MVRRRLSVTERRTLDVDEGGGKDGDEGEGDCKLDGCEDGWRGEAERAMGSCGNEREFELTLGDECGEDEEDEARSFLEGVELLWPMVVWWW